MQVEALNISRADPDSPIPLYHQVESDLRRLLQEGAMAPGSALPAEHHLCDEYGVSRHTMRKALSGLVDDRLIERRAGRGTFVTPQAQRAQFYLDRSFTRQMDDMGQVASSRVLASSTGVIDERAPDVLHDRMGAPCLQLDRLRFGDGAPIGLQRHTIVTERCPDLAQYDFATASLYDVLASEYALTIAEIQHTISAAVADEEQADLLDVTAGDPLLVVHTAAFLDAGSVIEHTTSHYRADRYVYKTRHTL